MIGAGAVIIATFLGFLILQWGGASNEVNRPQRVTHFTEKTPAEIAQKSYFAKLKLRGVVAIPLVLGWWYIADRDPEFALTVHQLVIEILLRTIRLMILLLEFVYKLLRGFIS